jgi:peroxiredoxin Q/BCP
MQKGDTVPDFTLPDQTGTDRSLSGLLTDGPVVLFFYPAAMTYGCTKESCHFRDLKAEFAAVGAQPVGISADAVEKQKQFDEKESLGMPLLSDPERVLLKVKRATFVIDTDRTILDVINSEVSMASHADKALALLKSRTAS